MQKVRYKKKFLYLIMSTRFQDSTFTFPHGTIFAIGQFKYPYFRKGLRFFNQTYRGSIYSQYLNVYDLQDYGYLLWISNILQIDTPNRG